MRATEPPLGCALRALRQNRNLSQVELARRIGRRQSLISRWESGDRDPTPFDLMALAAELSADATRLLVNSGPAVSNRRRASRAVAAAMRSALGVRLRAARLVTGLDPTDVSDLCGIRPHALRRLEEGRGGGSAAQYRALFDLYEVSVEELVGDLDSSGASGL